VQAFGFLDGIGDGLFIGDVDRLEQPADLRRLGRAKLGIEIEQRDLGPARGQQFCRRRAQARGPPVTIAATPLISICPTPEFDRIS
jgi:hypothetical protein